MKVQVTKTIRNIVKLRYEDGMLKVVANCFLSNKRLRKIIEENSEWINRQKENESKCIEKKDESHKEVKVVRCKTRPSVPKSIPKTANNLENDIFDGRKTVIMGDVVQVRSGVGAKTYLDGNVMYVSEKYFETRDGRLRLIKAFLKKMAVLYVSDEIAKFGTNVSLCPSKIEFRDNADFWVNCSSAAKGILSFDYRIVQLPQNLRLYVIAHGFAHFLHPIHDDKFWNYISNVLPRYRDYANELDKYRLLRNI